MLDLDCLLGVLVRLKVIQELLGDPYVLFAILLHLLGPVIKASLVVPLGTAQTLTPCLKAVTPVKLRRDGLGCEAGSILGLQV